MNFKNIGRSLVFLAIVQSSFIAYGYQRYYDVVQDAMIAETLDEATTILRQYSDDKGRTAICTQLQTELQIWVAEYGSCEQVKCKRFVCELCRNGSATFSLAAALVAFSTYSPQHRAWAAIASAMGMSLATMLSKVSKEEQEHIHRYERICDLIKYMAH